MTVENPGKTPKKGPVIAIDGPAGTGKSSATKRLAEALGYVHVDTGALYRSLAYLTREFIGVENADSQEGQDAENIARVATDIARHAKLEFKRMPKRTPVNRVFANGRDVTERIRTPEVSLFASKVSAVPEVRAALLGLQRKLGCEGKTILEGRDIGTVVFPDADLKFFLTASVDERAKRRLAELEALGGDVPSYEELKRQISERDQMDSTRAVAPLKRADDAIAVDTTQLTLDQVVEKMIALARERIKT